MEVFQKDFLTAADFSLLFEHDAAALKRMNVRCVGKRVRACNRGSAFCPYQLS